MVDECEDATSAIASLQAHRPDVVFLDVQLPGATGFDVLHASQLVPRPFIVFASAHSQPAVQAFDADAADYLLKPFNDERLARSLQRVRAAIERRREGKLAEEIRSLVHGLEGATPTANDAGAAPVAAGQAPAAFLRRVAVTIGSRTVLVKLADVDWFEASGNYIALHVGPQRYLVRQALSALERQLDPEMFTRIHRSAIVHLDRVREIRATGSSDFTVTLLNGTVLPMSHRYRGRLRGQ